MKLSILLIALVEVIVFLIIFSALLVLFGKAFQSQDRIDCLQWQRDAEKFPGYFLTKNQKSQCDYFNIEVAAPIKN